MPTLVTLAADDRERHDDPIADFELGAETQKPRRQRSGCGAARDGFGISLTAGGINFVVTTLSTRCPGISINRFPIVIWGTLSANAAGLLAVPTVSTACLMLWMDRQEAVYYWFRKLLAGSPALVITLGVFL